MSLYLPTCCRVQQDNRSYVVVHYENSPDCRHDGSGGNSGQMDGKRCSRAIGHGKTKTQAIENARANLGFTE